MLRPVVIWTNKDQTARLTWNPTNNATVLSLTIGNLTTQTPVTVPDIIALRAASQELLTHIRTNE